MDWGQMLKPRWRVVWRFALLFIAAIIPSQFLFNKGFGAYYAFSLPFPIKVVSCGTGYPAYVNCTYPWMWWGIILSILFWAGMYMLLSYFVCKESKWGLRIMLDIGVLLLLVPIILFCVSVLLSL